MSELRPVVYGVQILRGIMWCNYYADTNIGAVLSVMARAAAAGYRTKLKGAIVGA